MLFIATSYDNHYLFIFIFIGKDDNYYLWLVINIPIYVMGIEWHIF